MRTHILAAILLYGWAATAQASRIVPAFSTDGTNCVGTAQPFVPFNVYVVAILADDFAVNGIQGAEFRVDGFDPAWITALTRDPASQNAAGDPLGNGVQMSYATCQQGPVLLYSILVFALAPVPPTTLEVTQANPPSNMNFQCPSVLLCGGPLFTRICVGGGTAEINPEFCACCIATQPSSWSRVKSLYTN